MAYFPRVRSDITHADVAGLSSAVALTVNDTYVFQTDFTDVIDYSDCIWHIDINPGVPQSVTKITVLIQWSGDELAFTTKHPQGSESISSGISTLSKYEAEFDVTSNVALPAISLPVAGPYVRIAIKADDTSTNPTVWAKVWRKA
jgi:hypothetical protein